MDPAGKQDDHTWEEKAKGMCHAYGLLLPTQDEIDHMTVFAQAFAVYRERETEYGAMWKTSGAADNAQMVKSKWNRMTAALTPKVIADSALDLINYAAFFFLNMKAGRR